MEFTAPFIKIGKPFDPAVYKPAPSPIFRQRFMLDRIDHTVLQLCAIGYGYCYINGRSVTEDLFCAPVSEYNRLIWYNEYDVSSLLHVGENCIALILGNGFFNENFPSSWGNHEVDWRNHPMVALSLNVNGKTVLQSGESFLCTADSFVTYNQLRSGETFNALLYNPAWNTIDFDDSDYDHAIIDEAMTSVPREKCYCEPIREFEEYDFLYAMPTEEGYLLDFGVNISGYLRMHAKEAAGTEIVMRHAEEAYPDGRLKLNNLDLFYPTVDFQTDRIICGEQPIVWSPKFTYHGFRFVQVSGLSNPPEQGDFKAVFVHQAVEKKSDFRCSDDLINKIYDAAIRSTYSNLFYALTDCPTREKFGWTNDAQASLEQIYINLAAERFFEKWSTDIRYCMREDGQIPAIIPSHNWGFDWGPVADGIVFELPYKHYLYTGDSQMLLTLLPYMERYYLYFTERGYAECAPKWLDDWDGHFNRINDKEIILLFYTVRFCSILQLAQSLAGVPLSERYEWDMRQAEARIAVKYVDKQGLSVIDSQTVISMLLSLGTLDNHPLIDQLKRRIEADNFHLTSGMLGLQFLYDELVKHGASDYAYRLITVKGHPSYSHWFECGATSLWETWESGHTDSRNHHMLSGVIAFFHKTLLGIAPDIEHPGFKQVELKPCFIPELTFCEGYVGTPHGEIRAAWKRTAAGVEYRVVLPKGITATFQGNWLAVGENVFTVIGV